MSTGTVKFLHPGDVVWDYSFERPSDAQLRNVDGVSRYLTVVNDLTRGKMLTYDEAHHLADLGVATMLNFEWNAGDPLQGASRGVSNAKVTNQYRHESGPWGKPLDWPDEIPVVVSLDVSVTTAQLNGPVTDYFQAFKETYTGPIIGSYHGIFLHRRLQELGISNGPFWTAGGAWSWSGSPSAVDDPPTQIVQRVSGVGGRNDLLVPVPFWDPNGEDLPPQEDDVTPDECRAVVHEVCDPQFKVLWDAWTADLWGNGWPAYNALQFVWDQVRLDKHQLVDAVAAAVVAALPPGTAGLTKQDVVDAVLEAMPQVQGRSVTLFENP